MFRKAHLIFLLLALLAIIPVTSAQDETFGLSAEDFALLSSPDMEFETIGFDFAFDLAVAGIPGSEVTATFSGNGLFGGLTDGELVGTFSIVGDAVSSGQTTPVNLEAIFVDSMVYVNPGDGQWRGTSQQNFMEQVSSSAPLPVDPAELASGDLSENPEVMQSMMGAMQALASLEPSEIVLINRLDDVNGSAHFEINIDLPTFFSSEAFAQLLGTAGEVSGQEDDMSQMAPMIGMLLQDTSLVFNEYVNVETNRLTQFVTDFGMNLDPAVMGQEGDAIVISLVLDINNLQYDVPVEVSAPADAIISE